ncbi:hypothetical protein [Hymenobacter cellulosilyticus]|uniref:Lipoprotein n=1 Tax=Hymenobacter cellulosilyticus TaxID=2932248 RepID=A0A8T9Q9I4_9BACT|nr:hypothetical protein [Hymenobacter cellulosilyticus]UOQ74197.1 hypothetical protein MUN79_10080 [Hymenobacter cellulosilyticus]
MKKTLLLLSCAGALTMAACSQEKTTDTSTTTVTDGAEGTAMNTSDMDSQYRTRANTIATRMASDLKIQDTATVSRVRMAYYNRARRMAELRNQYTTDTTGMAAAMREASTETDTEFKSIFTDPTQYQAYETNRSAYDESNYMDDNSAMSSNTDDSNMSTTTTTETSTTTSTEGSSASGSVSDGTQLEKLKAKDAEGNKLKVKDNGKVKTKAADGTKTKTE